MQKEKLYTINEIEKMTGIKRGSINYARKKHLIEEDESSKPDIRFTESEVKKYIEYSKQKKDKARVIDFDLSQNYKFLPTSPRVHKCFGNPAKFQCSAIYLVGDKGTIINADKMHQLTPQQTGNGHLQVVLRNGYQPTVETLVGLMHCPNAKFKGKFHHINGDKTDNRAINLVAVDDNEHVKAHRLLSAINQAATEEEKAIAEKEYDEFIAAVRADNKEDITEDLIVIDDIEFPSDSGDEYKMIMFVTVSSYEKYLETSNHSGLVIKGQGFIQNK